MNKVFLSLGSNVNAEQNIEAAINALKASYEVNGALEVSPVYESESVGFDGDNFLNLIVAIYFDHDISALAQELKALEDTLGRVRNGPKFSARVIDIDIVLFGDLCGDFGGVKIPRGELTENAYVLLPLMDLSPNLIDPLSGNTIHDLWKEKSEKMTRQKLWRSRFQYYL